MRRSSYVLKTRRVNRKGAKNAKPPPTRIPDARYQMPDPPPVQENKPQMTQIDADQNPCPQITRIPLPPGNTTEARIHRLGGVDTSAGIRGCAADSSCDVRLSASKLWSRSPSQLLPILWMGAGSAGRVGGSASICVICGFEFLICVHLCDPGLSPGWAVAWRPSWRSWRLCGSRTQPHTRTGH